MSMEGRQDEVVARLKNVRDAYEKCLQDVGAQVGNRGSEWSIADLLRHASGEGYPNRITQLLEEDRPKLPGFDPTTLTPEQLNRRGERGGQPIAVIGVLETHTAHLEEHLAQLRDEIRPREGLPGV
jgi:hypothetical protein